ncbi:MAG: hypothetical protein ACTSRE_15825 [Promethearchaeota archaeon]
MGLIDSVKEIPTSENAEFITPELELVKKYRVIIQKFNSFYDHMQGYWSK